MIEIRTDEHADPAHPDGPHDHEQTRAIAEGANEAIRLLNYATMSRDGLRYPSDVSSVLGDLIGVVGKLPQSLDQMVNWIVSEVDKGHVRENADYGKFSGDTKAAVGSLGAALFDAAARAADLQRALSDAQVAVGGMESTRDQDQDQDGK